MVSGSGTAFTVTLTPAGLMVEKVHNDEAGDASKHPGTIAAQIDRCGHSVVSRAVNDDWYADRRSPVDLVVVAGGDGTVSTVARRLARKKVPVAVLPMGTANNVAVALEVVGLATHSCAI